MNRAVILLSAALCLTLVLLPETSGASVDRAACPNYPFCGAGPEAINAEERVKREARRGRAGRQRGPGRRGTDDSSSEEEDSSSEEEDYNGNVYDNDVGTAGEQQTSQPQESEGGGIGTEATETLNTVNRVE